MLRFRVLGPLEVERDGLPVSVDGGRQRAVLSILLLHANRLVTTDRLMDDLWGDRPPQTATTSLHNAISQLRKVLGSDTIETRPSGYVLRVGDGGLDAGEFERLVAAAPAAPPAERARLLDDALRLWRGGAWADVADEEFAQAEIRRLEELQVCASEERMAARLEGGEAAGLVGELEALVALHPYRERLHAELMLALYRSGRQADALDAFHAARRDLVDQLGIEPGRELQELHGRILRQDRTLDAGAPARRVDHLDEVLRALFAGRLIPVLGPGSFCSGDPGALSPPADVRLAERLADAFDCPPELRGSLVRVSQYVELTEGIGPLYDEIHALLDRDLGPAPAERFLATLPPLLRSRGLPQLLIVTTSYDESLETALRDAGEEFDVVAYVARGRDRGKFLHVPATGPARVVEEPNADAAITTEHVPVVLKIHGCVDRRPTREWESFVVSEDDYIDYLATAEPASAVPVTLAAKLRRSHFLFLGYGVLDWNLRVFLRRMWGDERVTYRSWAVQPDPEPLTRDFWRHRDVDVVDAPLSAYVAELAAHTADLARVAT